MQARGRGGRTVPAARRPRSPRAAAARRSGWRLSHAPARAAQGGGRPWLASAGCFFFPLPFRLCAPSHVGAQEAARTAGRLPRSSPAAGWGRRSLADGPARGPAGFPAESEHLAGAASHLNAAAAPGTSSLRPPGSPGRAFARGREQLHKVWGSRKPENPGSPPSRASPLPPCAVATRGCTPGVSARPWPAPTRAAAPPPHARRRDPEAPGLPRTGAPSLPRRVTRE